MVKVAPSLLAADLAKIGSEIIRMKDAGSDWLHFDVMDGAFVPNLSFGPAILSAAVATGLLPCDVHLMIERPERYIEAFAEAGAKVISIHVEAAEDLVGTLRRIRKINCLAGAVLNPSTPASRLGIALGEFDLALVMTVNPGFGGQKMIESAVEKIPQIRAMLDDAGIAAEIEVDGGVNAENAPMLIARGATVLVAGSALFGASDPAALIRKMKGCGA